MERFLRRIAASLSTCKSHSGTADHETNNMSVHASSSRAPKRRSQCLICLEECLEEGMLSCSIGAPASGPVTRAAAERTSCKHLCCRSCVQGYASARIASRKFPLTCPSIGCAAVLPPATAAVLLKDWPQKLQVLKRLELEASIDPSQRIYCPHKDCSAVMRRPGRTGRTSCQECRREFCSSCLSAGWHTGYTCAAFQRLPLHQRSPEDARMLSLVQSSGWKQCPGCGLVVERISGCDYMVCRCGTSFCYKCGRRNTAYEGYCSHR